MLIVETPAEKIITTKKSPSFTDQIPFRIFAVLWAFATLFHMAHSSLFDTHLNYALLTLAALYVIVKPTLQSFIIFISLQLFDIFTRMPLITNHWLFTGFVNLTILQALLYVVIRNRSFNIKEDLLLKTFAPIVRIEIIILYFFAVFHKLNSGFFTPATSCATTLLEAQNLDKLIPITPQIIAFNAYFTLIMESLIPLLLLFRKTRDLGILVGIIFHCILSYSSYNAFYDFSSMIVAAYFLFSNNSVSRKVHEITTNLKNTKWFNISREKPFTFLNLFLIIIYSAIIFAIIFILNKKFQTFKEFHLYFFWSLYSLFFIYCFTRYLLSGQEQRVHHRLSFSLPHLSFIILPLIVFLNGLSPYLGLKTENSYAMFSNLRTEGGTTNHFVVPASMQVFDFQKDVVEIISSSDKHLQELAAENKMMVFFEFKNYIFEHKPQHVEYLLNGERKTFHWDERASDNLIKPNPYLLYKILKFRSFSKNEPQPCSH